MSWLQLKGPSLAVEYKTMVTLAKFYLNGVPAIDRGYDATCAGHGEILGVWNCTKVGSKHRIEDIKKKDGFIIQVILGVARPVLQAVGSCF